MEKKLYIVTYCDMVNYGYGTTTIKTFTNKEDAYNYIRENYLTKCKKECIEQPFDKDSYDYQLEDSYAFIYGKYYWDCFESSITI